MVWQLLRWARKHATLLDLALGGLLAAAVAFDAAIGPRGQPVAGTAALVIGALAVGWRRRYPGAVVAIAIGAYLVDQLLSGRAGPGQTAVLVSVYTLAAHGAPRVSLAAAAVAAGAVIVGQSAHGTPHRYAIAAGVLEVLAAAMLGWLIAERCREQERERQRLAESAATEERVRIARELHDVVAHHLSVIVVQANVLADSSGGDHRAEAISARAIVDSGRRALADMRRILGVLRADQDDSGRSRAPQPGLEQLGALVDTVRSTGLNVEVQIEGGVRPLPEAVDLSAYRILQEALTNVLRHARATTAKVRITYTPTRLELLISDDGVGVTGEHRGDEGHGLAGMHERALMFGGEFTAGSVNGKGYAVRVVLPL